MDAVPKTSEHWQFALACAVEQIDTWVKAFDFQASLSGHAAYVGITPDIVIATIDGFLGERESIPGGTATNLEHLRKALVETITPAFEEGKMSAHNRWAAALDDEERNELMYTPPEEVMSSAWASVPDGLSVSQANWFVEAFCCTWATEWFEWQVSNLEKRS